MTLGQSIKLIRTTRSKETQAVFSKAIGVNQNYLSQIETGKYQPSAGLLERISKHVGIPTPILFWYGVEESDIKPGKLESYRIVKPMIDSMMDGII